jgi:hypothetical protein
LHDRRHRARPHQLGSGRPPLPARSRGSRAEDRG